MITIQNADAALKDYYLEAFTSQLNGDVSPFFNAIEKSTNNVVGKDVQMAIVKGNLGNVAACDEDGDLPSPYTNRYYNVTLPLKNIYGTIEISDKALRASRDSAGAFVNLLNAEMDGLVGSAKGNFARMLFGDGNGYLCTIKNRIGSYQLSVDDAKNYYIGLTIDIYDDTELYKEGFVVTNVDPENKLVTVDTALPTDDIKGMSLNIHGANGKELLGLRKIFGSGKLYGYDKVSERYFKPLIRTSTSENFSESAIVSMIDDLDAVYDSKVNMIICSHKYRKRIAELLKDQRRVVNTTELAAGYSSVIVNDVPVFADKFCPENNIYFLNTEDFCLNQLCDWEWLEDEDGKILKQVGGKAAYSATLVKYAELICRKPCGQGMLVVS
jgi:hypothetical protein